MYAPDEIPAELTPRFRQPHEGEPVDSWMEDHFVADADRPAVTATPDALAPVDPLAGTPIDLSSTTGDTLVGSGSVLESRKTWRQHLGILALTAAGSYGMHRGFELGLFDSSKEFLGDRGSEVTEVAIISSTLAVTSLREYVTGARLRSAERKLPRLERRATKKATGTGNTRAALDQVFPPTDAEPSEMLPRSILTRTHERKVKRMNRARDKAAIRQGRINSDRLWFGQDMAYTDRYGQKHAVNDFGTQRHIDRLEREPRTKKNLKAHQKAIRGAPRKRAKVEKIVENIKGSTPGRDEFLQDYNRRRTTLVTKVEKLRGKQAASRNRQDWQSKAYDKAKVPVVEAIKLYKQSRSKKRQE